MLPTNKNSNLKINNDNVETGIDINQSNYLDNLITTNNLLETSFLNIEPNKENLEECDNKSYCYQAIECLNSDISSLYNSIHSARVHLCIYNVNTRAKNPYLEYFLVKNNQNDIYPDILSLPSFFYYKDGNNDILDDVTNIQKMLLIDVANITFKGYLLEELTGLEEVYLFYEYKNKSEKSYENDIGRGELNRNDILWRVVIDEIVNTRLVCNFPIDDIVTNFFLRNMQFMFLFKYNNNENNIIYETPTVVYNGVNESMLYFKYIFGIPRTNQKEIMGSFYYFTNYKNAIKMAIDDCNSKTTNAETNAETNTEIKPISEIFQFLLNKRNKEAKIGIIRSVVFLGVNKVPSNFPEDDVDNSFHYSILSSLDNENVQINRISDHDGLWTDNYDSVYIGKLLLDNGKFIDGTPLWVVKDYNQQSTVSYHHLSSKLLSDEWLENEEYLIM
jgi:hypothetical protein